MRILKCIKCGRYTLKEECPVCNSPTENPRPPRYSPRDPYGRYRRMMKKQMAENVY